MDFVKETPQSGAGALRSHQLGSNPDQAAADPVTWGWAWGLNAVLPSFQKVLKTLPARRGGHGCSAQSGQASALEPQKHPPPAGAQGGQGGLGQCAWLQASPSSPHAAPAAGDPQGRCWGKTTAQLARFTAVGWADAPWEASSQELLSTGLSQQEACQPRCCWHQGGFFHSLSPGRTTPHGTWHFLVLRTYQPGATFPRLVSPPLYLKN